MVNSWRRQNRKSDCCWSKYTVCYNRNPKRNVVGDKRVLGHSTLFFTSDVDMTSQTKFDINISLFSPGNEKVT